MKNNENIWIIGLGLFGHELTKKLINNGYSPFIVDKNNEKLMSFKNTESVLFVSNTEEKEQIKELDIGENDIILITLGQHFEASILTCHNFLDLGFKNLYVQTINDTHEKILKSLGVKNIIRPYKILSNILFTKFINEYELITTGDNYSILKVENKKDWNKPLNDFDLRENYNMNILLIERNNKTLIPIKNLILKKNDLITFLIPNENINKSKKLFN